MAYKTVAYGLTHEQKLAECSTGFSASQSSPNAPKAMTTLMANQQTELWANNKVSYFATYAPNGVSIYPWEKPLGWKRREYTVEGLARGCSHRPASPNTFESTRFKFSREELSETKQRRQDASLRKTR